MNEKDLYSLIVAILVGMACLVIWARHDMSKAPSKLPQDEKSPGPDLPPETLPPSPVTGAQIVGAILAVAGLTGMVHGFLMEIDYQRVVNLGLMNDRLVTMIASGFGMLTGALLIIFGAKK